LLQVDANAAYTLAEARQLAALDPFDLLLIEQPLAEDDVRGHAELARMLRTPICLDESITSARAAADAIALGACRIVNIKPGRVGGYLEARRVHDVCAAHGVPVWCGGMLETGIGRAHNIALSSLQNFSLPGDVSASRRYWVEDIIEPEVTVNNQWSDRYTVIEVSGLDRPGLLYQLTTAISKLNLNIASAHVATFGERARDVFYVTDLLGAQISAPTRQAAIRSALLHLLASEKAAA